MDLRTVKKVSGYVTEFCVGVAVHSVVSASISPAANPFIKATGFVGGLLLGNMVGVKVSRHVKDTIDVMASRI